MGTTARRRLLVAVRPQDRDLVVLALGTEFDLTIAYTGAEALMAVQQGVDMIICGVHFDEGRMFELLRALKADPRTQAIPFVPVLGYGSAHSEAIRHGIRSAALSLGAAAFIDLEDMAARYGVEQGFTRLRQMVHNALP